jgi:hypothetical protein
MCDGHSRAATCRGIGEAVLGGFAEAHVKEFRQGEPPNTDDLRIFNRRWTPMNTDKIKASPLHPRPSASICGSILFSSCLSGQY